MAFWKKEMPVGGWRVCKSVCAHLYCITCGGKKEKKKWWPDIRLQRQKVNYNRPITLHSNKLDDSHLKMSFNESCSKKKSFRF